MPKFKIGDRISNGKTEYTVLDIQTNKNGHLCYRFNNPANPNFLWVTSRADQIFKLIEEPANRDFESEWKRYIDSKGGGAVTINVKDMARHFAEWGRNHSVDKSEMVSEETVIVNDWQYGKDPDHAIIPAIHQRIKGFNVGDKVRIIVIKEE